jgi:hypothetical protein
MLSGLIGLCVLSAYPFKFDITGKIHNNYKKLEPKLIKLYKAKLIIVPPAI